MVKKIATTRKIALAILALANICQTYTSKNQNTQAIKEKPMVVVIPSYNNKDWYKLNLNSVFKQDYKNYRVIYIDDASPDGTGDLVAQHIKTCGQEHRTILINNPKNTGAMANIYKAVHTCSDKDIIVTLDGDDWFKDKTVLKKLNQVYQDPNIWMTYGQYEELHYKKKEKKSFTKLGHCKQIPPNVVRANAYRETEWLSSHLRTFYAGLFKQIKLQDFLDNGNFYKVSWDMAFMMPMLEMAKGKFKFIEDVVYVYNCITPLNDFKTKLQRQLHMAYVIRSKNKYNTVKSPFREAKNSEKADLVIIAEKAPAQLYAMLESIEYYLSSIEAIYVLHKQDEPAYKKMKDDFKNAVFLPIVDLKESLEQVLSESDKKYILFAKDNMIVKDFVDIRTCIEKMEDTHAHGFYLSLGKNIQQHPALENQEIAPNTEIKNGVYAWQFKDGQCDWKNPNNLLMTMYRKDEILETIKNISYNSSASLEKYFNTQKFDLEKVGLFFESSKAVAIKPENENKIIELFSNGMKINILPFFLIKNTSTLLKTNLSFGERLRFD